MIKVDEVFCWTDSKTTLHWIKGVGREYKQFVENRVKEIRQNVTPESWSHCPGIENPADLPSRGMKAEALKQSETWWHGPPWLVEEKNRGLNLRIPLNPQVSTLKKCASATDRSIALV